MTVTLLQGDCREVLRTLPDASVHACVTSPPYFGLRRYSDDPRELGREATPEAYIANLVAVFREVRRVLRPDGVCLLNLGDSYNAAGRTGHGTRIGHKQQTNRASATGVDAIRPEDPHAKPKDKLLIPYRAALALQADGWYVRADMPWVKRNPMPESVTDRPGLAHEYVFLLARSERYFWDAEAVRQPQVKGAAGSTFTRGKTGANGQGRVSQRPRTDHPTGRNFRSADLWFASLDDEIANVERYLDHLRHVRDERGLLMADDDDPLALYINPTGYRGAHFAVFPPTLVEPLIRAACPAQACPQCGAGWARSRAAGARPAASGARIGGDPARQDGGVRERAPEGSGGGNVLATVTAPGDLAPTCACVDNDGSGRGVVLDPFGGSGTVGAVAERLGRDAILIELNAGYLDLQRARLGFAVHVPEAS